MARSCDAIRHARARRSAAGPSDTSAPARRAPGWPETWTKWSCSVSTSTPRPASLFCSSKIESSLPGMMREEKITASPEPRLHIRMIARRPRAQAPRAARPGCRCRDRARDAAASMRRFCFVDDGRKAFQISRLARGIGDAVHRAADQRHLAAMCRARHARWCRAARHWTRKP